ncbi:enoyl-CoA hydratase family protein [Taklimakanibacter albus]|uniref:Enoyl-CoA hydratase family protein n=1 Tax=Taklimakanibacter albus TaxID=2800327 RepID=A0ACC5R862_9HYPH|nr:enoyl-CoA hydratase family protein [Aestuariivirga sp. YIM B02566]MBK1868809.1 enoyl-CoA hydratase family protein [Aestuariivirga sp. YIM B02566]
MNRTHAVIPPLSAYKARHVLMTVTDGVASITLNRPEKKNPLTFDSYDELTAIFAAARKDETTHAFVISGAGGNFSSGGDVLEIIGPLTEMNVPQLLRFTEMTGDLVKTMRACPQPIISAIDGICAGAGAIIAMASDLRFGTEASKIAFLFNRVGLAGCDMGACAMLPRIIGQGRASELLYTGRALGGAEAERWGFFNRLVDPANLIEEATKLARQLASGPTFANGMTKRMLQAEWAMSIDDAVEAEAIAQALCMKTEDFRRAYEAFANKQKPVFKGD